MAGSVVGSLFGGAKAQLETHLETHVGQAETVVLYGYSENSTEGYVVWFGENCVKDVG